MKKLFAALLLSFTLFLAACGEKPVESVVLADTTGCTYTIIRPDVSESEVVDASVKLRKSMEALLNVDVTLGTDWVKRGEEIPADTPEILIGATNRTQSSSLAEGLGRKDYVVDFDGTRVTIVGGSDEATAAGVDWFIENCFDSTTGQVAVKLETHRYIHDYLEIDLNGSIENCVIDPGVFGQDAAIELQALLYDLTDVTLELAEGNGFRFLLDTELNANGYSLYMDDNGLILSAGSVGGFDACVDVLGEALAAGETLSGSFVKTGSFALEAPETLSSPYFVGLTDKNPLTYESGETMTFSLTLYDKGEPIPCDTFEWTINTDHGKAKYGEADGSAGSLTLTTSCPEEGFARVTVKALNDRKVIATFDGGAGANVDEIMPTRDEPADFMDWWNDQIALLDNIEPTELEHTEGGSGYYAKINMGEMDPVSISVAIPAGAEKGSLKLRMQYHGYGVSSQNAALGEGYITIMVNAHSIDNGKDEQYYADLKAGKLASFGFNNNDKRETCYFYEMILRDMQAVRYGMTSEYWNGEDIEISGGSMGGFRSMAMAALLGDKATKLTLIYPWLCDLSGRNNGRMSGWMPTWTEALDYFDTINFARHVTCPTTIDAGLGDYTVPPSGNMAMYNVMTCEKSITYVQNRTHSYYPPVAHKYTLEG